MEQLEQSIVLDFSARERSEIETMLQMIGSAWRLGDWIKLDRVELGYANRIVEHLRGLSEEYVEYESELEDLADRIEAECARADRERAKYEAAPKCGEWHSQMQLIA